MSRDEYQVVQEYTGGGDLVDYDFDFLIGQASDLEVVIYDADGLETERVRGDDVSGIVDSIDFDSEAGGGTVTLVDELGLDYTLQLILAPDEPTQPNQFRDKGDFTLRALESALDWLGGIAQRVSYLAQRSIRLHDADDVDDFDMKLPQDLASYAGYFLGLNAEGDGWEMYSADDIAGEVTIGGPETISNGMAATDIEDMTADGDELSSAHFVCEVLRGTTIGLKVDLFLVRINSVWYLHEGLSIGTGDHGLTFSIANSAATIAQVQMADADASGAGTLKFKKVGFNAA